MPELLLKRPISRVNRLLIIKSYCPEHGKHETGAYKMKFHTSATLDISLKQIEQIQAWCGGSNYMGLSPNFIIISWGNKE